MKRLVLLFLLFPSICMAGEISLSWDAVAEATGYKLHYGTNPEQLDTITDVGNVTAFTVAELTMNTQYFFKVSCYNDTGESPLSPGVFGTPKWPTVKNLRIENL